MNKINFYVLGTMYTLILGTREELPELAKKKWQGWCDYYDKEVKVIAEFCDGQEHSNEALAKMVRETVIHEVIHAYQFESGCAFDDEQREAICMFFEVIYDRLATTLDDQIFSDKKYPIF